ncbi:MAG: sulfite exporter TauE/SafE family protein, partial [Aestuariivirga sp.]
LGMGIIFFTIYALFSHMSLHQANALRNITISLMTLISIVIFARAGVIRFLPALVMMSGAVVGSYFSAKVAMRVDQRLVRRAILVWAVILTGFAFWKYY